MDKYPMAANNTQQYVAFGTYNGFSTAGRRPPPPPLPLTPMTVPAEQPSGADYFACRDYGTGPYSTPPYSDTVSPTAPSMTMSLSTSAPTSAVSATTPISTTHSQPPSQQLPAAAAPASATNSAPPAHSMSASTSTPGITSSPTSRRGSGSGTGSGSAAPAGDYDTYSPLNGMPEAESVVIPPLVSPSVQWPHNDFDDWDALPDLLRQDRKADFSPRRPMNIYFIYMRVRRPELALHNPNLSTGDLSKLLGKEWNSMTPDQKAPWNELAERLMRAFKKKFPDYQYERGGGKKMLRKRPRSAPSSFALLTPPHVMVEAAARRGTHMARYELHWDPHHQHQYAAHQHAAAQYAQYPQYAQHAQYEHPQHSPVHMHQHQHQLQQQQQQHQQHLQQQQHPRTHPVGHVQLPPTPTSMAYPASVTPTTPAFSLPPPPQEAKDGAQYYEYPATNTPGYAVQYQPIEYATSADAPAIACAPPQAYPYAQTEYAPVYTQEVWDEYLVQQ